ncbi:UNKNOWN [Stylonychia lemnae]|uniref:Endonuclease/exonuclease/phosphatase domain-containing protein n=1 Tax=Stylonychia lemnae TaxID=5949 RepID=A0A077ZN56_STYLE|nr:UNKNOWN [Stylonychia lemnae]|eukprot:CDW71412.1 UNKNOWN [Stylonychia lemnae]
MGSIFSRRVQTDIPLHLRSNNVYQFEKVDKDEYKGFLQQNSSRVFNGNEVLKSKWEEGSLYSVFMYKYNGVRWLPFENDDYRKCTTNVQELKFLTYNVWFDDHFRDQRYQVIHQMIEETDADFVCLQEVTQNFLFNLLQQKFLRQNYYVSGNFISGYGVMILSKFPCLIYEMPLPTLMNRTLLVAEPIGGLNGEPLLIATAHLESGSIYGQIRKKQLQLCLDQIKISPNTIMMGDFNFDSTYDDQQAIIIENGFTDVFLDLNEGVEQESMLKNKHYTPWRPDKVISQKINSNWRPHNIQIVGKFCIPQFQKDSIYQLSEDGIVRTPSDHMGIISTFKFESQK